MPDSAVLIAPADLLAAMKARIAGEVRDVQGFSDVEALRALELITSKRPTIVVLERRFAVTPRGNALVNRIKADPALGDVQIRVVQHDAADDGTAVVAAAPSAPAAILSAKCCRSLAA